MADLSIAAAAFGTIKAACDLTAAALDLKESTKVRLAISDILDKLLAAQRQAHDTIQQEAALFQRVRELEEQVRSLEARRSQLERYERKRFQPGSTAYVLKPELAANEEPHYACANCYEGGQQIRSLQPTSKIGSRRHRVHRCPSCQNEYEIGREMGKTDEPEPAPDFARKVIRYPPTGGA